MAKLCLILHIIILELVVIILAVEFVCPTRFVHFFPELTVESAIVVWHGLV